MEITPFKGEAQWSADRQIVLEAINDWINNDATDVDDISPLYAALEDPGNPDTLLPAYSFDWLHLSNAGYDAVAAVVYANAVYTGVAPGISTITGGDSTQTAAAFSLNGDEGQNVISHINFVNTGAAIILENVALDHVILTGDWYFGDNCTIGAGVQGGLPYNTSAFGLVDTAPVENLRRRIQG
jgi:hypothetical protein